LDADSNAAKRTSVCCPELMTKFCKCHELPLYLQLLIRYASASSSCNQMAGKQAKVLSTGQVDHLLAWCLTTRQPLRNRALVLLSVKAGLRAGEIANLTWDMVVGPTGAVEAVLDLHDSVAKNGSGRRIPLHPDLRYALIDLRHAEPDDGPVIKSERDLPMTPRSVVNWFADAYRALSLSGCSSHSGRRTFITRAARLVHQAGGSLRDVQLLAGHQSIQTTQRYIDGDTDAQRRLVSLI
jgi:integrase